MKVLFAGPSLGRDVHRLREQSDSLIFAGPAARGDIARAVLDGAAAIGIVDGNFEDILSVWHKEILFALASGVSVAGAASMGSLRAAECSHYGMLGIGRIYERYACGDLVDDSDVAQIHAPAELDYLPLSEPWVNIEPTLDKMISHGLIDLDELEMLKTKARELHFKQRTYRVLFSSAGLTEGRGSLLLSWVAANSVNQKKLDALELVDWLVACPDQRGPAPQWVFSDTTHWRILLGQLSAESQRPRQAA